MCPRTCSEEAEACPGLVPGDLRMISMHGVDRELYRAIRTGQLRALPPLHTRPINVMVFHGPQGDLVLR